MHATKCYLVRLWNNFPENMAFGKTIRATQFVELHHGLSSGIDMVEQIHCILMDYKRAPSIPGDIL